MATPDDTSKLVAKSESVDEVETSAASNRRERYKTRNKFFSLSFRSSENQNTKTGKNAPSGIPVRTKLKSASVTSSDRSMEEGESTSEAGGRKTPNADGVSDVTSPASPRPVFSDESFEHHASFDEEEMFGKGIVDLDESRSSLVGSAVPLERASSTQSEDDLILQIEKAKLSVATFVTPASNASSRQPSIDESTVAPETEEKMNLKTQFKGAFYNIGSTEDILKEFANEEEARKLKLVTTPSVDEQELPPFQLNAVSSEQGEATRDDTPLIGDQGKGDNAGVENEGMPFWKKKNKEEDIEATVKVKIEAVGDNAEKIVPEDPPEKVQNGGENVHTEKITPVETVAETPVTAPDEEKKEEPKVEEETKEDEKKAEDTQDNGQIPKVSAPEETDKVEFATKPNSEAVAAVDKEKTEGGEERTDSEEPAPVTSEPKSEKSPLISQDGDKSSGLPGLAVPAAADLNVGSRRKGGGILCCSIL